MQRTLFEFGECGLNLFVFFLAWVFVFLVPIPPARSRLRLLPRFATFAFGLLLFPILVIALTPLSLFVYWMVYLRLFFALLEYAFQIGRRKEEEEYKEKKPPFYYSYKPRWTGPKITPRIRGRVIALLFIVFLLFSIIGAVFTQVQRVSNAYYFNGFIQSRSGLPFNHSIPDSEVRLVTEEWLCQWQGDTCQSLEATCECWTHTSQKPLRENLSGSL